MNVERAHLREVLEYFGQVIDVDLQRLGENGLPSTGEGGVRMTGSVAAAETSSSSVAVTTSTNGAGNKNAPYQKAFVELRTGRDAADVIHGMHMGTIDGLLVNVVMLSAAEMESRLKGNTSKPAKWIGLDRGRTGRLDQSFQRANVRGNAPYDSRPRGRFGGDRMDRKPMMRRAGTSRSPSRTRSPSKRIIEGRRDDVRNYSRSPVKRDAARNRSRSPIRRDVARNRSRSPIRRDAVRNRSRSPIRRDVARNRSRSPIRRDAVRNRSRSPIRRDTRRWSPNRR
ncbi:hypothetical protein BASA61_003242 [Batrachochytrium salamandrivorans]|nr:hypothetical protein BASA61_003242 [Batrachochytrium salamandrivorans]